MLPQSSSDGISSLLVWCRKERRSQHALRLCIYIQQHGFDAHFRWGNHIVSVLAEVGNIIDARRVFDRLPCRTLCSWNSLIKGYAECGDSGRSLVLYQRMLETNVLPNRYTYVALLAAFTDELINTEKIYGIHIEIYKKGLLGSDVFVAGSLIHAYAKRGLLEYAEGVFNRLSSRNTVVWNTLIAGYTRCNRGEEAISHLKQMQDEGFPSNSVTFFCGLKACGMTGATDIGIHLHAEAARKGWLENNQHLCSALIEMYINCGSIAIAQEIFDKVAVRDSILWTTLISGYVEHDFCGKALQGLELMELEGISPNAPTFLCSLKACSNIGDINKGIVLHVEIVRRCLQHANPFLGNCLVDMYARCGLLSRAREIFNQLPIRDVISWNVLIAAYTNQDLTERALNCIETMHAEGVSPDADTLGSSLKACTSSGAITQGQETHAKIVKLGLLCRDVPLENALIDMYSKCGLLDEAQEVFLNLPEQDVVSWTTLLVGYSEQKRNIEILRFFERMKVEGVLPNAMAFLYVMKALGDTKETCKAGSVHAEVVGNGMFSKDYSIGDALIGMYTQLGEFSKAQLVFKKATVLNEVSWNVLLAGYVKHGHFEDTLKYFRLMQLQGFNPDHVTFLYCLKACASLGASNLTEDLHDEISARGFLEAKAAVPNALINAYANCGLLGMAQDTFDKLAVRDVISWTSLITGYIKHDRCQDALLLYEQMQHEGIAPSAVTYIYTLKACGYVGAISKGGEVHTEIGKKGFLETHLEVAGALIDMYTISGCMGKAREAFDKLHERNVVLWNTLITGYAKYELGKEALNCFAEMRTQGFSPDAVTFLGVLNACNHAGLVDHSSTYLDVMNSNYGISPTQKHYSHILGLLCRVGCLDQAMSMSRALSLSHCPVTRRSLMDACRNCGNVELARQVFQSACGK